MKRDAPGILEARVPLVDLALECVLFAQLAVLRHATAALAPFQEHLPPDQTPSEIYTSQKEEAVGPLRALTLTTWRERDSAGQVSAGGPAAADSRDSNGECRVACSSILTHL